MPKAEPQILFFVHIVKPMSYVTAQTQMVIT